MVMKKLINDPQNVVDELIEEFVLANGRLVRRHSRVNAVIRKDAPVPDKVGVVIGGGRPKSDENQTCCPASPGVGS